MTFILITRSISYRHVLNIILHTMISKYDILNFGDLHQYFSQTVNVVGTL